MKRYTLEEANQLLSVIVKEFDNLHELQREFDQLNESYQQIEPHLKAEEKTKWKNRIHHMELKAEILIGNILSHGVWFEDVYSSTIHIPAVIDGKDGFFTWRPDEPLITKYESTGDTKEALYLVN